MAFEINLCPPITYLKNKQGCIGRYTQIYAVYSLEFLRISVYLCFTSKSLAYALPVNVHDFSQWMIRPSGFYNYNTENSRTHSFKCAVTIGNGEVISRTVPIEPAVTTADPQILDVFPKKESHGWRITSLFTYLSFKK